MPFKSEEQDATIKPRKLVFLLAIAGRIDAQSRIFAKKLDNDRYIYHANAVVDSCSSSYSMFKLFFEVFISNTNDLDLMHQLLLSPEGIAAIVGEALFLITFAFLASYFNNKKDKEELYKLFIVKAWPYFRDAMKGIKNAYKAWKSTTLIMSFLGGVDLRYLIIPVGLFLGVLLVANRIWMRHMETKRKKMKSGNEELLTEIQELNSLTNVQNKYYLSKIQYQNNEERVYAFFSAGVGGLIDGLYLYAGVICLAILPAPAFIAMAAICIFYTLACIVSRLYEEYDNQLQLLATQTQCTMEVVSKDLETTYESLLALQDKTNKSEDDWTEIRRLQAELIQLLESFEKLHGLLKKQKMHSYLTAGLLGVKDGLFAYGVSVSFLFMFSSIFLVTATIFPPAVLIAFISGGLGLMLGVIAYNISAHYFYLQSLEKEEDEPYQQLVNMRQMIQIQEDAEILTAEEFKESLKNGLEPKCSPHSYFQQRLEVLRSFFSGLTKGNNFANFAGTPFKDVDPQEHDHGSPVMLMLTLASAALFSIVLALRAFARGFEDVTLKEEVIPVAEPLTGAPEIKVAGESSKPAKKTSPDSPPRNPSVLQLLGLFAQSKIPSKPKILAKLKNPEYPVNLKTSTIQGLS